MHSVLEQLQLEFETGLQGLSQAQTQLRTADDPSRWSVQQIVRHLVMTYELSAATFRQRIEKNRPTAIRPNLRQRLGQVMVVQCGLFPRGRQAPAMVMPEESAESLTGTQWSDRTRLQLAQFDEAASKAEELFGNARAITHPILGPMSVQGWRKFHLIHGRHHLKQIAAIRLAHGCAR